MVQTLKGSSMRRKREGSAKCSTNTTRQERKKRKNGPNGGKGQKKKVGPKKVV